MWKFVGIFLLLSLITSCKQEEITIDFGYEYFGWEEGNYVVYDVMEVFHDINLTPSSDTLYYTLKTKVGEPIMDNEGRMANKYFRYTYNSAGNLQDQRVWAGIIAGQRAELVEENQRIIHLVFAVTPDKTWDRNAFNPWDERIASYQGINQARTIGDQTYPNSVRVNIQDFFSLVDHRVKYNTYAKDIGLVHRYEKDLTIANFDTLNIQSGREIYYTAIEYGKEEVEELED